MESILAENYGTNLSSFLGFWIEDYGAPWLQSESFSYWDPSNPSVSTWLINGTPIGASTNGARNEVFIPVSEVGAVTLQVGNDIAASVWLDAVTTNFDHWFAVNTINPNLESTTAAAGTPNSSDIVAAAERYAAEYSGTPNTSDCYNIASDIAAAAGAALPIPSGSDDPTQNVSGGFWRVVYRGSDPNPVTDWQTLIQPGDMVRMVWTNGTPQAPDHTTTVLSVNADGSITVFDNGGGVISIHTVNYDQFTVASSITIYRLSPDHLYLINGVSGETLNGSQFNNEFNAVSGDVVNCGPGNDIINVGSGAISVNGGGGVDTLVYSAIASTQAQFTDYVGHSLPVVGSTIFNPTGQPMNVVWSSGSEIVNNIANIQFTDATFKVVQGSYFISANSDNNAADVNASHLVGITIEISSPATVTGVPTLRLNDNEVAYYTGGSGTNSLTFVYVPLPTDNVSDLQVSGLNLTNGASISNLPTNVTGDLGLSIAGKLSPATVTQEINALYVTLYGIAATQAGVAYWENVLHNFDQGITTANAAITTVSVNDETYLGQQMTAGSPVVNGTTYFQTLYPTTMSDIAFVQALYQNMSNFVGTTAGDNYWLGLLQQAETTNGANVIAARESIAGQFVHDFLSNDLTVGATALGVSQSDYTLLVNGQQALLGKASISQYYSDETVASGGAILNYTTVTSQAFTAAHNVVAAATSDPASVAIAITGINNAVAHQDLSLV